MDQPINVRLLEKLPDGSLKEVDEREWTGNMVAALEHINYLTVGNREYETLEGRLDVETRTLELLLVAVAHQEQERGTITRN